MTDKKLNPEWLGQPIKGMKTLEGKWKGDSYDREIMLKIGDHNVYFTCAGRDEHHNVAVNYYSKKDDKFSNKRFDEKMNEMLFGPKISIVARSPQRDTKDAIRFGLDNGFELVVGCLGMEFSDSDCHMHYGLCFGSYNDYQTRTIKTSFDGKILKAVYGLKPKQDSECRQTAEAIALEFSDGSFEYISYEKSGEDHAQLSIGDVYHYMDSEFETLENTIFKNHLGRKIDHVESSQTSLDLHMDNSDVFGVIALGPVFGDEKVNTAAYLLNHGAAKIRAELAMMGSLESVRKCDGKVIHELDKRVWINDQEYEIMRVSKDANFESENDIFVEKIPNAFDINKCRTFVYKKANKE